MDTQLTERILDGFSANWTRFRWILRLKWQIASEERVSI